MANGIPYTNKPYANRIKSRNSSHLIFLLFILFLISSGFYHSERPVYQDPLVIKTNLDANGINLEIEFTRGYAFLNPLFAFWYEDTLGNFIQTLYIARCVGTGFYQYGVMVDEEWRPAALRKPATLPVWAHRRGILAEDNLYMPTPDNPVPDAVTGATPQTNFILKTKTNDPELRFISLFMEINQSYDWNDFYTLDINPEEHNYKDNNQPAIVYSVTIDLKQKDQTFKMRPIGHSHLSGKDGLVYRDMENITTALSIVREIMINVK